MKIKISEDLRKLAKIFSRKTDLYVVGGYIRDQILGKITDDIDICSSLEVGAVQKLLSTTKFVVKDVDKKLGSAKICINNEVYDYTTFRTEIYDEGGSHVPSVVTFVKTAEEDAKRRDFSVNCIYYNIQKDEFLDFYNGIKDIKKHKIRCVDAAPDVLCHDGVRLLRLARLCSQLRFWPTLETVSTAKKYNYLLEDVTNTRKMDELMLTLAPKSKQKNFRRGLKVYNSAGYWKYFFDVDSIRYNITNKVDCDLRFLGLVIDLVNQVQPDCISYYLEQLFASLGISKQKTAKDIEIVCGYFDALNMLNNKDYFFRYFSSFGQIARILEKSSKYIYRKYNFFYRYIIKYKVPIQIKDLKISGKDIKANYPNISEKKYSFILTDLLNKVFRAEIDNNKDCLLAEVKNYE